MLHHSAVTLGPATHPHLFKANEQPFTVNLYHRDMLELFGNPVCSGYFVQESATFNVQMIAFGKPLY
jgi:hypothetical protein